MTTDAEVLALGFTLPTGSDPIRTGDEAIADNARAAVDLYHAVVADPDLASVLDAAVGRVSRAQHAPALGLYFPEAEGAVGDGVTDDRAAILAAATTAAAASGRVVLKAGTTYALAATLAIPAGARLQGPATLKLTTAAVRLASLASDTRLEDVTLDAADLATSYVLEPVANADGVTLTRCRVTSTGGTGTVGFRTQAGVRNVTLDRCTFDNLTNCIKLDKDPDTVRVLDCYFTAWEDRAIWAVSSAGFASKNVWVERCMIRPHQVRLAAGVPDMTQVRQPIAFQGVDTDLHRNVNILDNIVVGANTSYDDAANPGSADLISVHRTNGLRVVGNMAEYGGDVGITVAQQSTHITVANNVCRFNDSAGICIGSAGSTSTSEFTVTGNVCMNNGQNRLVDGPSWALNGVNLNTCQRGIVSGNRLGDDQAVKTQRYGLTAQTTTDVAVGPNATPGNSVSGFHREGANTRLTLDSPPVQATKAADQAVNNSVALVDVADLSVAVAAEGVYQVEAFLIYNATATADLALKWSTPSGGPTDSLNWTSDAPSSSTTSPNSVIHRTSLTIGSTATIGGTAGNAVATPVGVLTVGGASGTLKLQMAQGTAEATDAKILAGSWLRVRRIA